MNDRVLVAAISSILLLLALLSVFVQDKEEQLTPLMLAANKGSPEQVKRLIQEGVDVNERRGLDKSFDGPRLHGTSKPLHDDTALMYAVNRAQYEIVEMLISAGAKVDSKDSDNRTVWDYMTSIGGTPDAILILKKIIASYPRPYPEYGPKNVFYSAVTLGHYEMVDILVPVLKEQGVVDARFLNAGMCSAARHGTTDKTTSRPVEIMDLLRRELGAIPDDTLACVGDVRPLEKYEYLLSQGADPNAISETGIIVGNLPLNNVVQNPVSIAYASREERILAIETLLKYGADPTRKDRSGISALELARTQGDAEIVKMLERVTVKH